MTSDGLGGVATDQETVVVGSRDLLDRSDVWQAYDAVTGKLRWQQIVLAPLPGSSAPRHLDYGNSPRATPLIYEGLVFVVGAFGDLACLDLATGIPLWKKHLANDFGGELPIWGFSGSPLIVDDALVIQPGGESAALVALDIATGDALWQTPGKPAVYASLIRVGDQLLGLDNAGVVGWNATTGRELWRLVPDVAGDFGVPTPVVSEHGLMLCSENNGCRLYAFDNNSAIGPTAESLIGTFVKAAPNSHSPVVMNHSAFAVDKRLYCLEVDNKLALKWTVEDRAFREYTSLIASPDRLLALTTNGTLFLVDSDRGDVVSRVELTRDRVRALSHPAQAGTKLYVRLNKDLLAFDLQAKE